MTDNLQGMIYRIWESACQDKPIRPSGIVENGEFVMRINGNRDNWTDLTCRAGVPSEARQIIDGDTLTCRWPSHADAIFGEHGLISKSLPNYEMRLPQIHMARLIQRAIEMNAPAMIEGSTGTGKSLAYAAICLAMNKRAILSTSNKNLQLQLYKKDLPFLQSIFPGKKVVLAVGRSNFACRAKCDGSAGDYGARIMHEGLRRWYTETATGNVEELTFGVDTSPITVDDECTGKHCPMYCSCFYFANRAEMKDADVIITNHALLCLNAITEGGILPEVDVVVVDEAHKLEEYARKAAGSEMTLGAVDRAADLANGFDVDMAYQPTVDLLSLEFERNIKTIAAGGKDAQTEIKRDASIESGIALANTLYDLAEALWPGSKGPINEEESRISKRADRIRSAASKIESVASSGSLVRWVEMSDRNPLKIVAQPSKCDGVISAIAAGQATIFTSATLAAPDLSHFLRTCGLPDALQMQAASPFDYENHALIYLPNGTSPAPNEPTWMLWMFDQVRQLVLASDGGAFLLFTSYNAMQQALAELRYTFTTKGMTVLVQGEMPKLEIAKRFKAERRAVLFATKSFWEGVDIQGDALRLVVIDKMPFDSPSPLTAAMEADVTDMARAAGLTGKTLEMAPFNQLRVPRMIIELKQGAGRLIRTATDKGAIAILDSRIRSAQYGRNAVMPALPPAPVTSRIEAATAFLGQLLPVEPVTLRQAVPVMAAQPYTPPPPQAPDWIDWSVPF